jgi:hypothetical protein
LPSTARVLAYGRVPGFGHLHAVVRFMNDYGMSVIAPDGGIEIGVIGFDGPGDDWVWEYDTGITSDVIPGIDNAEQIAEYARQIARLPKRRMHYVHQGLRFQRTSAAYIDVYWEGKPRFAPFTCVNIYDYAAGRSEVTTREEFEAKCREWLGGLGPGELENYRVHTLYPYL